MSFYVARSVKENVWTNLFLLQFFQSIRDFRFVDFDIIFPRQYEAFRLTRPTLSIDTKRHDKRWRIKFERMAEQDRRGINSEMLKDPKVEGATDDRHFRHRSQHVPGDLGSADDASNNNRSIMSPNGILGLRLDAANSFVLDVPPTLQQL